MYMPAAERLQALWILMIAPRSLITSTRYIVTFMRTLGLDGVGSRVKGVMAADSTIQEFLNRRRGIEELFRSHSFDAVKGLTA